MYFIPLPANISPNEIKRIEKAPGTEKMRADKRDQCKGWKLEYRWISNK